MKKLILVLALLGGAQPALAHAQLVKSLPAAGSQTSHVEAVVLTFTEKLEAAFSGAQLVDAAEKPVAAPVAIHGDTISFTTPALKPGHYRVNWHSVGQDTHRMEGSFQFTVLP
jgi:methionine-rich copper-binding protein CopC